MRSAISATAAALFTGPTLETPSFAPHCCVCRNPIAAGDTAMVTTSHAATDDPRDAMGAIWCASHGLADTATAPVRIGFDIGGVLSKYPREVMPLFRACLASPEMEVHVVTDMPLAKAIAMLALNEIPIAADRVHSCDYAEHGEECKAKKAEEVGLDILVDDFPAYVATVGSPPLRLLSMPDPTRDYYHEFWKTDGSEGDFGRRKKRDACLSRYHGIACEKRGPHDTHGTLDGLNMWLSHVADEVNRGAE